MSNIKLFESNRIRSIWDDQSQRWLFAIVDVLAALTQSRSPQIYWRVLKKRLLDAGNQTVTNRNGLKMTAPDGTQRLTDVADTEQLLRLIQSIPSPRAEPFKRWLAPVGFERLEETFFVGDWLLLILVGLGVYLPFHKVTAINLFEK